MKRFKCPNCNTQKFSTFEKFFSSKLFPLECECGAKVYSDPMLSAFLSTFVYVFLLLLGVYLWLNYSIILAIVSCFTIFVVLTIIATFKIPLVAKPKRKIGDE